MHVLVTGADGFIGSHLTPALIKKGHEVSLHSLKNGDISQENALDSYKNVDHLYHLAARTFVPDSWNNTHSYFQINLMGTVTALEFCRKNKCSMTLMSTYVYGEPRYLPIDENHPVRSVSPYHSSKLLCEDLCLFYSQTFGVKTTILRPFNVFGEGQNGVFLIPKIYAQVINENVKEISVMDLEPRRDYVYIKDVVAALISTLKPDSPFAVYNVGSGVSYSVKDVILNILRVTGIKKPYISSNEKRMSEISDCFADISRIKLELNFVPKFTLEDGLRDWHQYK